MSESIKPEPIIIQMSGVEPERVMNGALNLIHDWGRLLGLPPFQMYCSEISDNDILYVENWIEDLVLAKLNEIGEDTFFEQYCEWHKNKGYWKNEDVFGGLISVD